MWGGLTKRRGCRWLTVSTADGILTSCLLAGPGFVFYVLFFLRSCFIPSRSFFKTFLFFCCFSLFFCLVTIELGTYVNAILCWHSLFFLAVNIQIHNSFTIFHIHLVRVQTKFNVTSSMLKHVIYSTSYTTIHIVPNVLINT